MSSVMIPATLAEPFALTLNVQDASGPVTGLTPTVRIRDSRTTNKYLDFSDLTFKTSGWSTKDAPLAEIGIGRYIRQADGDPAGDDPFLWTLDAAQPPGVPAYFVAEFDVPALNGEDDQIILTAALPGEEFESILDTTGNDALGWQEVQINRATREIRRFNLYDSAGRISSAVTADNLTTTIVRRELV